MTHISVSKLTISGSDDGLLPGRYQAFIWTNAWLWLIGPLGTNFSEISIEIHIFHSRKCIWKCRQEIGVRFVLASMCSTYSKWWNLEYGCTNMILLMFPTKQKKYSNPGSITQSLDSFADTRICYYVFNRPIAQIEQWASCQISKIAGWACAGNAGNVTPSTAGKRSRHASRHVRHARAVMHAGIVN